MGEHPSDPLLLLALLCVSTAAVTNSLDENGICKSLVETRGYTCREHQVITEDGYILGLQRILSGQSGCFSMATQSSGSGFGVYLGRQDKGFDVWLANSRGTMSSRGHTSLSTDCPDYWEWSWDELAANDLPAFFNYVNAQTGQKSHYVGHSLGTLTVIASLSQQKLKNSLRSAALLSPIAYLSQISTEIVRVAANLDFAKKLYGFGLREFPSKGGFARNLESSLCRQSGLNLNCSNILAAATVIRRGSITKFDYGPIKNFIKYNNSSPPVYKMADIPKDIPLFLSYGGKDTLSDVNDVKAWLNDLQDHDRDKLVARYIEGYAHLDFIFGDNANKLVYDPLLAFFNQT